MLSSLRWSIMTINSTRVDISLAEEFQSWIVSFIPYFKEWVGVEMFWSSPMLWNSVSPLDGLLTQIPKS